jgi:hypothetical protein
MTLEEYEQAISLFYDHVGAGAFGSSDNAVATFG